VSGISLQVIQAHGTWSSDALFAYIDAGTRDATVPLFFLQFLTVCRAWGAFIAHTFHFIIFVYFMSQFRIIIFEYIFVLYNLKCF
jgi:hypothetical protein